MKCAFRLNFQQSGIRFDLDGQSSCGGEFPPSTLAPDLLTAFSFIHCCGGLFGLSRMTDSMVAV
jgi:hypothetical protein